jgi:hypothetical protein
MPLSLTLGLISGACIFSGALLGLLLRFLIPDRHLQDESKDVIKLGAGMVATVSALVLGLLVASAKNTFDATEDVITQRAAKIVFLDRVLSDYGPETQATRDQLRDTTARSLKTIWSDQDYPGRGLAAHEQMNGMQQTQQTLLKLTPTTEAQRQLLGTAQQILTELRQSRWLLILHAHRLIPLPFLIVLLFWLSMLHVSFGLFAPRNPTVITVLFVSALSVSAAIFVVLDMSHPLQGVIKVSTEPTRKALELLGQ